MHAATMAVARSSNPDDELFVIEFNDRPRLYPFSFIGSAPKRYIVGPTW